MRETMTSTETSARAPLARFVDWYEALSVELRAHIGTHLFRPGMPQAESPFEDAPRTRRTTMGARLSMIGREPERQAELVQMLAARTDEVFADAAVKELFTGESKAAEEARIAAEVGPMVFARGSLEDSHARRRADEAIIARSMEWMRAAEQWAGLREAGLAPRRIERWLEKRDHDVL